MQTEPTSASPPIRLIVNADDYGYFRCVSDGILAAIDSGVVTSVGIMATGPHFASLVGSLRDRQSVDAGVHLDLSWGVPITAGMRRAVSRSGRFRSRAAMAATVMLNRAFEDTVRAEWNAQIEAVLEKGIPVRFLNSHEHLHLLPPLNRMIGELAEAYGIPFVRHVTPEWRHVNGIGSLSRNLVAGLAARAHAARNRRHVPCIGLGQSGRLDMTYLRRRLASVPPGSTCELMCHPGGEDAAEVTDPRLHRYHAWGQELTTLLGEEFRELRRRLGVALIRYRDIPVPPTLSRGQP